MKRMEEIQLVIKNADDRRSVVAILADNGYTVSIERVKLGTQAKTVVVAKKEKPEV